MASLEQHRERFRSDPGDDRAFEALEERLFLDGDWRGLAALYDARLRAAFYEKNPRQRGQVLLRKAQVIDGRLRDPDGAVPIYWEAIKSDPHLRPALQNLRRIHAERAQWDVALQIAELELAAPMRPDERAGVLAAMGSIWLEHLGDAAHAVTYFERARDADARHRPALAGLAGALEATGRSEEAAEAWGRLVAATKGRERARALVAQARVLAGPLGRAEEAGELFRRALTDDPRNPSAVEAVAEQAAARGQWTLLADLVERRFELAVSPGRRAEIAIAASGVYREHLDQPDAARAWLERAAELDPGNPLLYEAAVELERAGGDEDALLEALTRWVELRGDAAPVSALMELATLRSDRGDPEGAAALLETALSQAPDDALVLEALADVHERLGRFAGLVDLLERRAAVEPTDARARAAVLAELARVHAERLGDPDAAREAWRRAFEADPALPGAAQALAALLHKAEAWDELEAVRETAARRGPEEERAEHWSALGALRTVRGAEPAAAARAFEEALAHDPTHAGALQGLQRLAVESGDEDALLRAFEREAAITTEPERLGERVRDLTAILEERGRPELAVEWVERWMAAAPRDPRPLRELVRLADALGRDDDVAAALARLDPLLPEAERGAVRREIGRRHARRGRDDEALAAWRGALEVDPDDREAWELLARALERAQRPEERAEALARLADLVPPAERARPLAALAELLASRLGRADEALAVLERLRGAEGAPPDVDERREALLERTGRFEELLGSLSSRRARAADAAAVRDLDLRRAELLLDRLGRAAEATALFRGVLGAHPDDAEAGRGLERALRASGDRAGLAELLRERADRAPDAAERERCAFERAELLAEDDPGEAAGILRALHAESESAERRRAAGQRLESLLAATADWPGLRAHWEDALAGCEPMEAAELRRRLAALCRDRQGDLDAAAAHGEAAAEQLESAGAPAPERASAWRALADVYARAGRPAERARALEGELACGPEPARGAALLAEVAALCADVLDDPERARVHWQALLEREPGHATASEWLIAHHARAGRPRRVAELLEQRIDALLEELPGEARTAQATALRLRLAELRAGELADPDGAIAALEAALDDAGPVAAVATPLADLYERRGGAGELEALCRSAAEACADPAERAGWWVRLGSALREHGRDAEAAAAYRCALADRPDDASVRHALADLHRRLDEPEALARLLAAELESCAGVREVPPRMELAALLADRLERPDEALVHVRRVLEIDPESREARDRALALAERIGDDDAAATLLAAALPRERDPAARAQLLVRRAELLRRAGRAEEAIAACEEALACDPERDDARAALRELLLAAGRWQAVLAWDGREAERRSGEARVGVLERAADLAWERVGPDAALPWLLRLRAERPDDAAVCGRIASVHRRAGRGEALATALLEQAAREREPARRRALHAERARVLEGGLGASARAAAAWEAARAEAPDDPEALCELDRLYAALDRPRERALVLERRVQQADGAEAPALACAAAELFAGPLGEPERAVPHLRRALEAAPPRSALRAELLRHLAAALRAAGRPEAWAACCEEELASLDASPVFDERRCALRLELARACEHELFRPREALAHLRALWEAAERNPEALPAESREEVETSLLRGLRAERSVLELSERLAARLARRPDDAEGWIELARLRAERLAQPAAAASAWRRALEAEPGSVEALRGLRAACERLGDFEEVARTLERELEVGAPPPAARAALLRRLGRVCETPLRATTRARRAYAAALETDPEDFESLRALEALLEAMEDWDGALDLYGREIEVLDERDPERCAAVWLRMGEIARDRRGDVHRALRAYARAAELGPLPPARRRELAELHWAGGDRAAFAEAFAGYCDDARSNAGAADHVRLAEVLAEAGEGASALDRTQRAIELEPGFAPAWDLAARLHEERGDLAEASETLARAAELSADGGSAQRLLRAAELVETSDPIRAAHRLRRAAALDPGDAAVQRALARVAAAAGDAATAQEAAARALDLAEAAGDEDAALRLDAGLAGGRAARARGRPADAVRFYEAALAAQPEHPEALGELGETLAVLDDTTGARRLLERRLADEAPYPERAYHLALVGEIARRAGDGEEARRRFEAALALDPAQDDAHDGLARVHEAAGRVDDAARALVRFADAATEPGARALRLLRAARLRQREGRADEALRHLRAAVAADPGRAEVQAALAELLCETDRAEEALGVAARALEGELEPRTRARLSLLRGHALERAGDPDAAVEAFAAAAETDPRCADAALAQARLLRSRGEWERAAEALCAFADRHPGDEAAPLAEVLRQLGRLLAGPLEDVDGALGVYRRALELDPECGRTRAALASLLKHLPEHWREALDHHRRLLAADPTDAAALRGVLAIAEQRRDERAVADGRALLAALGAASPAEAGPARPKLRLQAAPEPRLGDPVCEALRRLAEAFAPEIADALGASHTATPGPGSDAEARFRSAVLDAEGRLSAPALVPLAAEEALSVLRLVAALGLEPDAVQGDGHRVNALASALGRRARRRARKLLDGVEPADLERADADAWRLSLRGLAAAVALDETGGDLCIALRALCRENGDGPDVAGERTELAPFVAACPPARELMSRVVSAWIGGLE